MARLGPMRIVRIVSPSQDTRAQSKYGARGTEPYAADGAISRNIAPGKQERALTMTTKSGRTLFAAGLITAALASGAIGQQDQKLGKVTFPTSCDPAVQAEFDGGVAMLHSYWFLIARRKFEGILQQDPTCAMAYWGVAMDLLGNTLAATPTRADAQAAWDALEKARAIGAKTQRERDWIETLSAYFRDHDKIAVNARLAAYNAAMAQMAQSYPDDYEVQAFYALALQAAAPKSDLTYANQIKSAALLEKLFEQNPQHPGVTHYLIHAYDFAPLAEKGIASARRYAGIAPAVPHARHMPSHIYSMVGFYGLRTSAARAGCQGRCDDQEVARHRRPRRSSDQFRQFHRQGRDAGALRPGTSGLGRRCRFADDCHPISHGGFVDPLHTWSWHGAHWRSCGGQRRDRSDEGFAHDPSVRRPVLLGRPHR